MLFNRSVTIVCLVGGLVSILLAFLFGSSLFAVFASFFFALTLLIWKYGYLIIPAITKATNIVEIRNDYEIPPTRDLIVKKTDNGYYATKFLEIRFYESSLDKTEGEKRFMFESFEKAIISLKHIVKISLLVAAVDLSKHIDEIKTKRSSAESRKARMSSKKADDAIKLDREIAMYNRYLDRLTNGERPVELIAFVSTTAFGLTKEEAGSKVKRQSNEVKTILSSSLGSDVVELSDKDMIRCFDWETFFPTTSEQLRDEVF